MTPKDILEAYGIDFATLKFQLKSPDTDGLTESEVRERLATDEIVVDGELVNDIFLYGDTPHGWLELYPECEGQVSRAEGRCG
jgi:hypothetical protein